VGPALPPRRLAFTVQGVLRVAVEGRLDDGRSVRLPISAFGEDAADLLGEPAVLRRGAHLADKFEMVWLGRLWRLHLRAFGGHRVELPSGRVLVLRERGAVRREWVTVDQSLRIRRHGLGFSAGDATWREDEQGETLPALLLCLYGLARSWQELGMAVAIAAA